MGFSRQGEIYCDETSNEKAGMLIHTGHCRRCEFPNRLIPRRVAPQQSPLPLRRVINYTQSQQVSRRAARGAAWVRLLEGPFSRRRKRASRLWHDFPLDIEGPHISRDSVLPLPMLGGLQSVPLSSNIRQRTGPPPSAFATFWVRSGMAR